METNNADQSTSTGTEQDKSIKDEKKFIKEIAKNIDAKNDECLELIRSKIEPENIKNNQIEWIDYLMQLQITYKIICKEITPKKKKAIERFFNTVSKVILKNNLLFKPQEVLSSNVASEFEESFTENEINLAGKIYKFISKVIEICHQNSIGTQFVPTVNMTINGFIDTHFKRNIKTSMNKA